MLRPSFREIAENLNLPGQFPPRATPAENELNGLGIQPPRHNSGHKQSGCRGGRKSAMSLFVAIPRNVVYRTMEKAAMQPGGFIGEQRRHGVFVYPVLVLPASAFGKVITPASEARKILYSI